MVIETIPVRTEAATITIEVPAAATPEMIKKFLDGLDPWVEGSEVNRAVWNKIVDALEDAEDRAAIDAWEAAGRPAGIPFEQYLKEAGIDSEDLKREL